MSLLSIASLYSVYLFFIIIYIFLYVLFPACILQLGSFLKNDNNLPLPLLSTSFFVSSWAGWSLDSFGFGLPGPIHLLSTHMDGQGVWFPALPLLSFCPYLIANILILNSRTPFSLWNCYHSKERWWQGTWERWVSSPEGIPILKYVLKFLSKASDIMGHSPIFLGLYNLRNFLNGFSY